MTNLKSEEEKNLQKKLKILEEYETNGNYNARVKARLIRWQIYYQMATGSDLNFSAISNIMENTFHINTSTQKVAKMFDIASFYKSSQNPGEYTTREIKLQELTALAQIFDIPLWDICGYPNVSASGIDLSKRAVRRNSKKGGISPLNDKFYLGKYYCYYFNVKHHQNHLKPVEESEIEEAELIIAQEYGHTTITLHELKSNTTFFGEPMTSFTLTGNLYRFENPEIAYSFIADETGRRAMALMFKYLNLSADIRYYMTVAMMTFSLNQIHEPLFQKMAVFKVRQKYKEPDTAEIIRGILSLNTCPIIIDEDTLNNLIKNDATMKRLISPEKALKKCYIFSEDSINSNSFFISDDKQRVHKKLQLRKNSLYPAHEIISESDSFTDFIKDYQRKQL